MPKRIARFDYDAPLSSDEDNTSLLPTIQIRDTYIDVDRTGRSKGRIRHINGPASPKKKHVANYTQPTWIDDGPPPDFDIDAYPFLDPAYVHFLDDLGSVKRKRTASDYPMRMWLPERDMYLEEMLRRDGRGDHIEWEARLNKQRNQEGRQRVVFNTPTMETKTLQTDGSTICRHCEALTMCYRCKDCFGSDLLCKSCTVKLHGCNPLHRIELWNGTFFLATTLKSLGLRIQLGHPLRERCTNPTPAHGDEFVVLDLTGIHEVGLDFCGCAEGSQLPVLQILRKGWYPATSVAPKTAATFNALDFFQLLTFESKASAYEFYHTLSRLTDNTGIGKVPDRYTELMRMIRQWGHLKMLKRAGRGHDPDGVDGTGEGELAVLCPACPHPGKNLPNNWQNAPANVQQVWLYALFLGLDANFRMLRKKVSSEEADPSLSKGWAFFCEITKYSKHLADHANQPAERSTCVKHHAVKDANTSRSENLASTGIGTVDCIRHNCKRPSAVADLQKGEKYMNMDYMFFSSLKNVETAKLVVSYDIACQWHVHLRERMMTYSHDFHTDLDGPKVTFLVPKFHLPAHVAACQTAFSFHLTRGVGNTDGEAPERGWSNINPVSSQTKQMGPGSRRDCIDNHFGDWNYKKVIGFGAGLLRKLKDAVPERAEHTWAYHEFSASLPEASVAEWQTLVDNWEKDNTQTNPFVVTVKTVTQHGVRLALADEEAAELAAGEAMTVHDDISPALLISMGMDFEAQQERLQTDKKALDSSATSLQLAKVQERLNSLKRKIDAWITIQQLYMPETAALRLRSDRDASDSNSEIPIYDIPLYLPSSLDAKTKCSPKLQQYEFKLREAQAYEALDELRQHLRLQSHMWKYKEKQVVGQRASTRQHNLIGRVDKKVQNSARKYRSARTAISNLADRVGNITWRARLPRLEDGDIRRLNEGQLGDSEGKKKMSWIWRVQGLSEATEDEGFQEALRIEWCRTRARAMRFSEEVLLLREEMRRVLQFLDWHKHWWLSQSSRRTNLAPVVTEGLLAYSSKQAYLRGALRDNFDHVWRHSAEFCALGVGADSEILEFNVAVNYALASEKEIDEVPLTVPVADGDTAHAGPADGPMDWT